MSTRLTAEQVRDAHDKHWHDLPAEYDMPEASALSEYSHDWQAIADELNTALGDEAKLCHATEANYRQCKYSTNRGWCDDAPFLVWDDTGHLFITMGGLKTWDVTDDAKAWFAALGGGECEDANTRFNAWTCSECKATLLLMFDDFGEPTYSVDGVADVPRHCPNCGKAVKR